MKRRKRIPREIEAEVLFRSDHTCCICQDRQHDVQLHHIDSDPANNDSANLAVLCPNCHSKVTGNGLGPDQTNRLI